MPVKPIYYDLKYKELVYLRESSDAHNYLAVTSITLNGLSYHVHRDFLIELSVTQKKKLKKLVVE